MDIGLEKMGTGTVADSVVANIDSRAPSFFVANSNISMLYLFFSSLFSCFEFLIKVGQLICTFFFLFY